MRPAACASALLRALSLPVCGHAAPCAQCALVSESERVAVTGKTLAQGTGHGSHEPCLERQVLEGVSLVSLLGTWNMLSSIGHFVFTS